LPTLHIHGDKKQKKNNSDEKFHLAAKKALCNSKGKLRNGQSDKSKANLFKVSRILK
jgi:hypothetical protein